MLLSKFLKVAVIASLLTAGAAQARLSEGEAAIIGFGVARAFDHIHRPAVVYSPAPVYAPAPQPVVVQPSPYAICLQYVDSVQQSYCRGQVDRQFELRRQAEQDAYQRGRTGY